MIKNHLKTLHDYLDSTHEYSDGTSVTIAQILSRLRPYPIPPFPAAEPGKDGFVQTILRKKLEPAAEQWVEDRIRTAKEFCDVPEDWGIETKPDEDEEEKKGEDEQKDEYGGIQRLKTDMKEHEITEVWSAAGNKAIPLYELFEMVIKRTEDRDEMSEERLEEIDALRAKLGMEDEEDEEDSDAEGGEQAPAEKESGAAPEQPAMPLGVMLKFMSTGVVDPSSGI
jgi:hypothetical protein